MNYTSVELGDIYQNSVYIQVNDTKFYSRSVGIRVSSPSLSLRPQVAFVLPVLDNYEVRLGMGYLVLIWPASVLICSLVEKMRTGNLFRIPSH